MSIKRGNKDVIGVFVSGHPITKIYQSNFIIFNEIPEVEYDIDIELQEINGQFESFSLNGIRIYPDKARFQANLSDLDIGDKLTSFSMANSNVKKINKLPTENVTRTERVFEYSLIETLDMSDWNFDKLNMADSMFQSMQRVTTINAPERIWDAIYNVSGLFYGDRKLKTIKVFPSSNHTNLSYMFSMCEELTNIECNWNGFSNVTTTESMFNGCSKLPFAEWINNSNHSFKELLGRSSVQNTANMFNGCDLGNTFYSFRLRWAMNQNLNMSYMFANTQCRIFELYGTDYWDWWRCQNFSHMFDGSSAEQINLSNKDFQSATDMSGMFANCPNLTYVNFAQSTIPDNCDVSGMFDNCPNLTGVSCDNCITYDKVKSALVSAGLDYGSIIQCDVQCGDNTGSTEVTNVLAFEWDGTLHPNGRDYIEYRINGNDYTAYSSPVVVDVVSDLGESQVTSLDYLFGYDDHNSGMVTKITSVPDMSNITQVWNIFNNLFHCTYINLAGQNLSNIQEMSNLFFNIGNNIDEGVTINMTDVIFSDNVIEKFDNWWWGNLFVGTNFGESGTVILNTPSCEITRKIDERAMDSYKWNHTHQVIVNESVDCNTCDFTNNQMESEWSLVVSTGRTVAYDTYVYPKHAKRKITSITTTEWCNSTWEQFGQQNSNLEVTFDCDGENYTGEHRTVNATAVMDDGTTFYYSFVQRAEGEEENITWHQLTFDTPRDIQMETFRITKYVTNGASGYYFAQFNAEPNQDSGDNWGWSICPEQQNLIDNGSWINFDEFEGDVFEYTMSQPIYWTGAEENACLEAIEYATFD